jgi:hypothetical protein
MHPAVASRRLQTTRGPSRTGAEAALEVLWFLAPFRRVEQRLIALNVRTDHRHLRSPIRAKGDDVTVRLVPLQALGLLRRSVSPGILMTQARQGFQSASSGSPRRDPASQR